MKANRMSISPVKEKNTGKNTKTSSIMRTLMLTDSNNIHAITKEAIENNASIAFIQNAKRYLSKMFYPIAVIAIFACMILFTSNSAMANGYGYGDYIIPDFEILNPAIPEPCDNGNNGDCDENWNTLKVGYNQGLSIHYNLNETDDIYLNVYEIYCSWRICNGILEVQINQIRFDEDWGRINADVNNGKTPKISQIPIQIYNGKKIASPGLPKGNYLFGIFKQNKSTIATGNFIINSNK